MILHVKYPLRRVATVKKEGRFYLVAALAGCLSVLFASSAYSQICEVDGLNGAWQVVCSGTECDCSQDWSGVPVTTSGSGSFVAINGAIKLVESVTCLAGTIGGTSCGWPGGGNYDECCRYDDADLYV